MNFRYCVKVLLTFWILFKVSKNILFLDILKRFLALEGLGSIDPKPSNAKKRLSMSKNRMFLETLKRIQKVNNTFTQYLKFITRHKII